MAQSDCSFSKKHFSSLTDLIEWVRAKYELEPDAGVRFTPGTTPIDRCRYLFRGEPGAFSESLPSDARRIIANSGKPEAEVVLGKTFSERRHQLILRAIVLVARGNARLAQMLLQHYGIPSDGLDVTANLGIAAAFAEASNSDVGSIAVIDTKDRQQSDNVYLPTRSVSLHFPDASLGALRPVRQEAVFLFMQMDDDLKVDNPCVSWYTFDRNGRSPVPPGLLSFLYADIDDRFSSLLGGWMDELPPLNQALASWFAERLGSRLTLHQLKEEGIVPRSCTVEDPMWEFSEFVDRVDRARSENAARWAGRYR